MNNRVRPWPGRTGREIMEPKVDRAWIKALLERNRYLVLSTTDGKRPWIAPLEYILDKDLNFYFLSPENVRHVKDLEKSDRVAVAVFDSRQPEYTGQTSTTISGIQIEATAARIAEADYPDEVVSAIAAFNPPMPPYAVFKISPSRFYVPVIEDGVNLRVEVPLDR